MLTGEEMDALKVGDEIEANGLFPPLSKEPLVLRAAARTELYSTIATGEGPKCPSRGLAVRSRRAIP